MILLTDRQKLILSLIVQEYVDHAKPVGSKHLVENYELNISSATIRAEMVTLSRLGFLRQPHTSAGREPTEDGYRVFVKELMQRPVLPETAQDMISHQFYQVGSDVEQWMRLAASILASRSQAASLVTAPQTEKSRFKHLELIQTTGRKALIVVVFMNGDVRQQLVVLNQDVNQSQLSAVAAQFNNLFSEQEVSNTSVIPQGFSELERDLFSLVIEEVDHSQSSLAGEVIHDGWSYVLAEPEFSEVENFQKAIRVLEEKTLLEDLMSQTVMDGEIGGIQVLIGGEGNWEELRDFSLILSRYGLPDMASGILGVLGPIRMSYGKAISTVNFVGGLLTNLVTENMREE